jgi:aminopeptidase-like protein
MNCAERIERYFDRLWPICRSIAGPGFRQSLDILAEIIPTERYRFATGTKVFDWTVPKEWRPKSAFILDPTGRRFADFEHNNLNLLSHSIPFHGRMSLRELKKHLYSIPSKPDAIPYLTSYYSERWGFCLSDRELQSLPEGQYTIRVDTELAPGHLELGEAVLVGDSSQEILISTYLCHPSLANNELSGPLVTAFLYERLAARNNRRFTYRFVICPETIGALCYLKLRGNHLKKHLVAGFVVTCVGDSGRFTYKLSRRGDSLGDRAARLVLRDLAPHSIVPFFPRGSDERQYCSPGFNLPVGSLMRTMYEKYPEYHTSLDNKSLISFDAMVETISVHERIVDAVEENHVWRSRFPFGEPQLEKRGLYLSTDAQRQRQAETVALTWLLNLADGSNDLLAIADRSGCSLELLRSAVAQAQEAGLIEPVKSTRAHIYDDTKRALPSRRGS